MNVEQLLAQSAEEYMSQGQVEFFRQKLTEKAAMLRERIEKNQSLFKIERQPDEADSASIEEDRSKATRLIEMDLQTLKQIDAAFKAIDAGEYGYCAVTGEPITLQRLLVIPESLLSVEAMQASELRSRHQRAA
ncbi:TPA: TraR/DksA family transcriptional regulator [Pseudomonas aeruginosa]|nr:TraR/DksA family transcriptional regulator [Pseudomonas aeruginosa]